MPLKHRSNLQLPPRVYDQLAQYPVKEMIYVVGLICKHLTFRKSPVNFFRFVMLRLLNQMKCARRIQRHVRLHLKWRDNLFRTLTSLWHRKEQEQIQQEARAKALKQDERTRKKSRADIAEESSDLDLMKPIWEVLRRVQIPRETKVRVVQELYRTRLIAYYKEYRSWKRDNSALFAKQRREETFSKKSLFMDYGGNRSAVSSVLSNLTFNVFRRLPPRLHLTNTAYLMVPTKNEAKWRKVVMKSESKDIPLITSSPQQDFHPELAEALSESSDYVQAAMANIGDVLESPQASPRLLANRQSLSPSSLSIPSSPPTLGPGSPRKSRAFSSSPVASLSPSLSINLSANSPRKSISNLNSSTQLSPRSQSASSPRKLSHSPPTHVHVHYESDDSGNDGSPRNDRSSSLNLGKVPHLVTSPSSALKRAPTISTPPIGRLSPLNKAPTIAKDAMSRSLPNLTHSTTDNFSLSPRSSTATPNRGDRNKGSAPRKLASLTMLGLETMVGDIKLEQQENESVPLTMNVPRSWQNVDHSLQQLNSLMSDDSHIKSHLPNKPKILHH